MQKLQPISIAFTSAPSSAPLCFPMAMRRMLGSFQPLQRLLGSPCRPALLHGGSLNDSEEKKLTSKSGMPADGEEVVACWSEDEASYSEAVVRATGRRDGAMHARCDAKSFFTLSRRPATTPNTLRTHCTGQG